MSDLKNSSAWQVSRCQSVKVKVVKLVFKTENMTLTSLTLTKMTALQRYSVTVQNGRCALQRCS